ncbi:hypothetical protein [Paenibacillus sp. 481]|uniref:hypothetical protein n=1 Tax=Paenibacillus sp. 481 TaxID=2835869 RepID=UPI001E62485B|nr:hypothetical protein [Paenibacillus sp. 481]UHA75189.1 hypothetical protein KIK04_09275 [Paenibacillus sp. 481]
MNDQKITAQLILAEQIKFDSIGNCHSAKNILNKISVPLFPAAVIADVLAKIYLETHDYETEAEFTIISPDDRIIFIMTSLPVKSLRAKEAIPGFDMAFNVRFPVVEEGNYFCRLVIDGELLCQYPFYVNSKE